MPRAAWAPLVTNTRHLQAERHAYSPPTECVVTTSWLRVVVLSRAFFVRKICRFSCVSKVYQASACMRTARLEVKLGPIVKTHQLSLPIHFFLIAPSPKPFQNHNSVTTRPVNHRTLFYGDNTLQSAPDTATHLQNIGTMRLKHSADVRGVPGQGTEQAWWQLSLWAWSTGNGRSNRDIQMLRPNRLTVTIDDFESGRHAMQRRTWRIHEIHRLHTHPQHAESRIRQRARLEQKHHP